MNHNNKEKGYIKIKKVKVSIRCTKSNETNNKYLIISGVMKKKATREHYEELEHRVLSIKPYRCVMKDTHKHPYFIYVLKPLHKEVRKEQNEEQPL